MWYACKGGNIEIVQLVINQGTVKDPPTQFNWNIGMQHACEGMGNCINIESTEHWKIIKLLINKRAEAGENPPTQFGWSCGAIGACFGGNMQLVQFMIDQVTKENPPTNFDWDWDYLMQAACSGGNMEIVQFIINQGNEEVHPVQFDWNEGMQLACLNGHVEIVQFIINKGNEIVPPVQFNWNDGMCSAYVEVQEQIIESVRLKHIKIVGIMITEGANDWDQFKYTNDLDIYKIYCGKVSNYNTDKLNKLIISGCPLYALLINYTNSKELKRLPIELIRTLKSYN
jgi:hypothetical protein